MIASLQLTQAGSVQFRVLINGEVVPFQDITQVQIVPNDNITLKNS